jgi:hypothetical protein
MNYSVGGTPLFILSAHDISPAPYTVYNIFGMATRQLLKCNAWKGKIDLEMNE